VGKDYSWALVKFLDKDNENPPNIEVRVNNVVIPVSQISMTYGLNAIPTASVQVALGRSTTTGAPSSIYGQVSNIKQMSPAEITVTGSLGDFKATGDAKGDKTKFASPKAPAVIFTGYVSGISFRRSSGKVTLVLSLVNKLFDLSASSAGIAGLVPGAPHDLTLPALTSGAGANSAGTVASAFALNDPELADDFALSLVNGMLKLTENSAIQTHSVNLWGNNGQNIIADLNASNDAAQKVLKADGSWEGFIPENVQKYELDVDSNAVAKAKSAISSSFVSAAGSTSLWQALITTVLPSFGVGIVPLARGARIAPILAMARNPGATIEASDYADFNLSTQSQRPLKGVGVYSSNTLATIDSSNPTQAVGGVFLGPDRAAKMWMFVSAPKWLDGYTAGPSERTAGRDLSEPAATATDAVSTNNQPEQSIQNNPQDAFAKLMYQVHALRGREGTLVGKLRFDIAPGTTVLIKSKLDNNPESAIDDLAVDLFAFVARVHILINAEQAAATTTFELTNIRTEEENNLDSFSSSVHPFFKQSDGENDTGYFKYEPLVPELSENTQ
jgi:hypothetical protein